MDDDVAARGGRRSPWWWGGMLMLVVAFGLAGATRAFPFDPDGWLGRSHVQALITVLATLNFIGGFWLVLWGRPGRRQDPTRRPE